jgi:hypothetical protein
VATKKSDHRPHRTQSQRSTHSSIQVKDKDLRARKDSLMKEPQWIRNGGPSAWKVKKGSKI